MSDDTPFVKAGKGAAGIAGCSVVFYNGILAIFAPVGEAPAQLEMWVVAGLLVVGSFLFRVEGIKDKKIFVLLAAQSLVFLGCHIDSHASRPLQAMSLAEVLCMFAGCTLLHFFYWLHFRKVPETTKTDAAIC